METLMMVLRAPEFWMGMSLVAAALPGPQTRILPAILKAIASALSSGGQARGN